MQYIKDFIECVKANIKLREGLYCPTCVDVLKHDVKVGNKTVSIEVPVFLDDGTVSKANGYKDGEAFAMAFLENDVQKFIIINKNMKDHSAYKDVMKHELAHILLRHKMNWSYKFNPIYRLQRELEADEYAVKELGACPVVLSSFLSTYKNKDRYVNTRRIDRLFDLLWYEKI